MANGTKHLLEECSTKPTKSNVESKRQLISDFKIDQHMPTKGRIKQQLNMYKKYTEL